MEKDLAQHIDILENYLNDLGQDLSAEIGDDLVGCGIFIASKKARSDKPHVFNLTHYAPNAAKLQNNDRFIYRRRLPTDRSFIGQEFLKNASSFGSSLMLSQYHDCANIPLISTAENIAESAMLQIALEKGTEIRLQDFYDLMNRHQYFTKLVDAIQPLLKISLEDRDEIFKLRDPYKANAVIAFFDINKFRDYSSNHGYNRAMINLGDDFVLNFIQSAFDEAGSDFINQNGHIQREGDGVWLALPLKDGMTRKKAIELLAHIGQTVIQDYADFRDQKDLKAQTSSVKALIEIGEIEEHRISKTQKAQSYISSADYTLLKEGAFHIDKSKDMLVLGARATDSLNGKDDDYTVDPEHFEMHRPNVA